MMTDEQKKLVEGNHNLIYWYLKNHGLSVDEYYGAAAIGLCNAAMTYDAKNKTQFSTYAYCCIENQIKMEFRHNSTKDAIPKDLLFYYESLVPDTDGVTFLDMLFAKEDVENDVVLQFIIDKYLNKLKKDRDKTIVKLIIGGYSHVEIGKMLNCSKQKSYLVKRDLIDFLYKEGYQL